MIAPVVLLMGPTASGKSALALELAVRFGGEIVSVDSAQVFRGMDIGTAKPDDATRSRIAHHLIDIREPTERYSAAAFAADAAAVIAAARARGRIPFLVGGTMLYFKALTEGLSALPPADAAVRARIDAWAARSGWPALHEALRRVDSATAARLAPGDAQRIQRALEVYQVSGVPLSTLQGRRQRHARSLGPVLALALLPDRALLHRVIAARFDAMLAAGLVEELRELQRRHRLDPDLPSMRCVGYRQAWQFIAGHIDARTLRERGIVATRQLAKRQYTWLRATRACVYDPQAGDTPARIAAQLQHALEEAHRDRVPDGVPGDRGCGDTQAVRAPGDAQPDHPEPADGQPSVRAPRG